MGRENAKHTVFRIGMRRIVAAAERLDATILYTEDLNTGQTYGSVTAIKSIYKD